MDYTKEELKSKIRENEYATATMYKQLRNLEWKEKQETFGEGASCKNCRYGSVINNYEFDGTMCLAGRSTTVILCERYKPDNSISLYFRNNDIDPFRMYDISGGLECIFGDNYIDRDDIYDDVVDIVNIALNKYVEE